MKNSIQKIIGMGVVMALTLSVCSTAFAAEQPSDKALMRATEENASQILLDHGYAENQFKFLPNEERLIIAKALLVNPELVQSRKVVVHVDELGMLEKISNSSNKELLNLGFSNEDITAVRTQMKNVLAMSDEELMSKFDKSALDVKLLREAIVPQENYEEKELEGTVFTSSDTKKDSDMEISNWVTNVSNETCNAVAYQVSNSFEWINGFVWMGTDEMITCWGGGLDSTNAMGAGYYTNGFPTEKYQTTEVKFAAPREQANLSLTFRIPTLANSNTLYAGWTSMRIFQKYIYNKYNTKVFTEYGHKYLGITSAGFSASTSGDLGVSISIGMAYWRSKQAAASIIT